MEGVIDKTRLIWPQLARLYENIAPYSDALIRFGAGAVIFYHGSSKARGGSAFCLTLWLDRQSFPISAADNVAVA
jgi:hypothetical protein